MIVRQRFILCIIKSTLNNPMLQTQKLKIYSCILFSCLVNVVRLPVSLFVCTLKPRTHSISCVFYTYIRNCNYFGIIINRGVPMFLAFVGTSNPCPRIYISTNVHTSNCYISIISHPDYISDVCCKMTDTFGSICSRMKKTVDVFIWTEK